MINENEKIRKLLDFGLLTKDELDRILAQKGKVHNLEFLEKTIQIIESSIVKTEKDRDKKREEVKRLVNLQIKVADKIETQKQFRIDHKIKVDTIKWDTRRKKHFETISEIKLEHKRLKRAAIEIETAVQKRLNDLALSKVRKKI